MIDLDPISSYRRDATRRPPVLAITMALATATSPAVAMARDGVFGRTMAVSIATAPPAASGPLRIEVEPSIDDADLLPVWIQDRNPKMAEKLPSADGHDQWVAVRIDGATYDYRVSVVAMRNSETVGIAREPETCECTSEKLLELVDARIAEATETLRTAPLPEEAVPEPAGVEPQAEVAYGSEVGSGAPVDRPRRLGTMGYLGIGVGVLGASLLAAGIPLALRPDEIRGGQGHLETRSMRGTGIVLAVGGGVVLAAGVTLLVVDLVRERQREVAVAPVLSPRQLGVAITWRPRGRMRR